MNNFICADALDKMAARIASTIPCATAAARYRALARQAMLTDRRTALVANEDEIRAAPIWAIATVCAGGTVHVFHPCPELLGELRRGARAVRDAWTELCELRAMEISDPRRMEAATRQFAEELFAKISRMSLDVVVERARWVASERRQRVRAIKAEAILFEPDSVLGAPGRTWHRIISIAELGRVGAELRNCLAARSGRHSDYARRLSSDYARFWVLRDEFGAAQAAAMVRTADKRLLEARAPRNAPLDPRDPCLRALVEARCAAHAPRPGRARPQTERLTLLARQFFEVRARRESLLTIESLRTAFGLDEDAFQGG